MYQLENEINCSFFIAVYMLSVSLLCLLCPFTEIYLCHTSTWLGWWWCCCVCVCLCEFFFFSCVCVCVCVGGGGGVTYWSGRSVNSAYELINLRAQNISTLYKNYIFQCTGNICMWNLKGTLSNSTKHILPIYWEVFFLFRKQKFESSSGCPAMSPRKIPWHFPDHFMVFPDHETYHRHFITALILILQAIWQITHQK